MTSTNTHDTDTQKAEKPLPSETSFTRNGWMHRQIKRTGDVAIYARHHVKWPGQLHYEVVRIKMRPSAVVFGKAVPSHEAYPCSESWGTDGWTYRDENAAMAKFKPLQSISTGMPEKRWCAEQHILALQFE